MTLKQIKARYINRELRDFRHCAANINGQQCRIFAIKTTKGNLTVKAADGRWHQINETKDVWCTE